MNTSDMPLFSTLRDFDHKGRVGSFVIVHGNLGRVHKILTAPFKGTLSAVVQINGTHDIPKDRYEEMDAGQSVFWIEVYGEVTCRIDPARKNDEYIERGTVVAPATYGDEFVKVKLSPKTKAADPRQGG